MAPSNFKAIGKSYYDFAPQELIDVMPPLMGKTAIRMGNVATQAWYDAQINEKVLVDQHPVANTSGDAGTLSGK